MHIEGEESIQQLCDALKKVEKWSPDYFFLKGVKYHLGKGVKQDFNIARSYYELAASFDHAKSLNNLGILYQEGQGVPQDYKKAIDYFEISSNKGNISAIFNLGEMYFNGLGVEKNDKKAESYYKHAAEHGNPIAIGRLEEIRNLVFSKAIEAKVDSIAGKREDIIQEILKRKIKYLIHFTHINNVESIIFSGFIPRSHLEESNLPFAFNDDYRMEGMKHCTCFSIEYPNEHMLDKYRKFWRMEEYRINKALNERMCIIRLDIISLFKQHEGDIYFTPYNSATKNIRIGLSISPNSYSTLKSFKNMFPETNPDTRHVYTRSERNLPDFIPTHHQAEVLISNVISPNYIETIFFNNDESYNYFFNLLNSHKSSTKIKCGISDFYFKDRDSIQWEKR